jgi:hypothetical protein
MSPRRRIIHVTADSLRRIMRDKGRWPVPIHGRRVLVSGDPPKRKLVLFGGREIEVSW